MAGKKRTGADAPKAESDVVVRFERPGTPLAFVRAGTARGRAWLIEATTAAEGGDVPSLRGAWPCGVEDAQEIARAARGAGLAVSEERAS